MENRFEDARIAKHSPTTEKFSKPLKRPKFFSRQLLICRK